MSWNRFVEWLGDNQAHLLGSSLRVVGVLLGAFLLIRLLRKTVVRVEGKVSEHTTPVRALQRTQTLTKGGLVRRHRCDLVFVCLLRA